METKQCSYCEEFKSLKDFHKLKSSKDGYSYSCKECRKKFVENSHKRNKENNKNLIFDIKKYKKCSECGEIKTLNNFGISKRNKDGLDCYCKQCRTLQGKLFRIKYKEKESKRVSNWQRENKGKVRERTKRFRLKNKERLDIERVERYKNDIDYRLTCLLRKRIRDAVYFGFGKKSLHTLELLGCSFDFLKQYLQKTSINNGYLDFDINTYNGKEYHIDHIRPCSSFDLTKEEEQKKCFHYSNLQILKAEENLIKGDKKWRT